MEIKAVYENGTISLVNPILFKSQRVKLLIVAPDSEIINSPIVKYQEIETELQQLASEDDMLQELWSDLDSKYLDGKIRTDGDAFAEALGMSGKY